MPNDWPGRESFEYAACYCEENVYRLLGRPEFEGMRRWALIVSNEARRVAVYRQRAGQGSEGRVVWDYHVLAIAESRKGFFAAFDLDTLLRFPCEACEYFRESFRFDLADGLTSSAYRAMEARFRLVSAEDYLENLGSDRSHMRAPDGSWLAPPPPWPAPGSALATGPNLMDWIDLEKPRPGRVLDLRQLASFFYLR